MYKFVCVHSQQTFEDSHEGILERWAGAGDLASLLWTNGFQKIVLRNEDAINLLNLKFISSYYKYAPEQVIKLKS